LIEHPAHTSLLHIKQDKQFMPAREHVPCYLRGNNLLHARNNPLFFVDSFPAGGLGCTAAEASKNMKDSEHEGTNKQITF
jgi:hypothetical protein